MSMDQDLPASTPPPDIDFSRIPNHVACVMDGNGRWANARGLPRNEGHVAGEHALARAVEVSLQLGVKWLTVYAFSTENWVRPQEEVDFLMQYNQDILKKREQELYEAGVRVVWAGRKGPPVPSNLLEHMHSSTERTKDNDRLTLTIAFNYGGRAEIVDAVRSLLKDGVSAQEVDEEAISSRLYLPNMPDVDLMIRTSNEFRISNFLLWQVAYSELYFTETLWPDFDEQCFYDAVRAFQQRKRRFGGL